MPPIQTLHIMNKCPDHPRASRCLAVIAPDDALLLIEDGVLLLSDKQLASHGQVFALQPDVDARGLAPVTDTVRMAGFADMVALSLSAQRVISW